MNVSEGDAALSGAIVRLAGHVDRQYEADLTDCSEAISKRDGLDYIEHTTWGIFDFAVQGSPPSGSYQTLDQAGRRTALVVARLDETIEQLDSGPLVRAVVQGNRGALFHILKVPGQSFLGITLDGTPATINRADRQIVAIADRAALRVGSPSLLWGGFRPRDDSHETWSPFGSGSPSANATPSPVIEKAAVVTEAVTRLCQNALHPKDLHFIGIYQHERLIWRADLFDHPALASLFQRVTPIGRRRGYDTVIRELRLQASRITQLLTMTQSDRLVRLVLDVARGAIFVLPLGGAGHYLVGVTLVQSQVQETDLKVSSLGDTLASIVPGTNGPSV
jgi:hypothetical protein